MTDEPESAQQHAPNDRVEAPRSDDTGTRLRHLGVPAGIVFGLMLLVSFAAPDRLNPAYFEVAAQVIPALLIVLALDGGVLARMNSMSMEPVRLAASMWVGLIFVGEVSALVAVAYGEPTRFAFTATTSALLFALALIIGPFLFQATERQHSSRDRSSAETP